MDFPYLQVLIPHSKVEAINDITGAVAMATPWWFPALKELSDVFTFILPAAGFVLIVVQVVSKILVTRKIMRGESKDHD